MVVELSNEKTTITLVSEDKREFEVSMQAARASTHLTHFMEVSGNVLEKIVEYLNNYKDRQPKEIPKPLPNVPFAQLVDEWDAKFVHCEQRMIFDLIMGANYLDIPSLLDLCCAKVASEIRGKNVDEIRKAFNIENDFTPEEEAQIREENRWCEPE